MKSIAGLFVVLLAVGCATVTRGTKEVLVVESDPAGAKVTTSLGLTGLTPATFKVSRKGGFTVTIEKDGFESVTVQVSSQVAGAGAAGMAGNVVLGGLIGAAVDAGTGACLQIKPNPIKVTLVPIASTSVDNATTAPSRPNGNHEIEPAESKSPSEPISFLLEYDPLTGLLRIDAA